MKYPENTRQPAEPTGTGGEIALDIEAINLVEPPDLDFQDPTHWSVFCIPIGHRPAGSTDIETDVLFRHGPTMCDEYELLEFTAEWIRDRHPDRILTYNGESYDYPILKHRAATTSHECPGTYALDMGLLLDAIPHDDLFQTVKEETGSNIPLESTLDYHDIQVEGDEVRLDGGEVTGADMPELGIKILSGEGSNEEYQAVCDYAESDVAPLFELFDCL